MASSEDEMPCLEANHAGNLTRAGAATPTNAGSGAPPAARHVAAAICDDGSDDDDDDEDWEEMDGESVDATPGKCLFCPHEFPVAQVFSHIQEAHGLSVASLVASHALDCFGYIRLVNYIRSSSVSPEELKPLSAAVWSDDKFMKPVLDSDPLLMIDMEDLQSPDAAAEPERDTAAGSAPAQGETISLPLAQYRLMQQQLAELRRQLQLSEDRSEQLISDMATMRGTMQQILRLDDADEPAARAASAAGPAGDSLSYFESYAHHGIHHEMLSDRVRTESYRDAIVRNADAAIRGRRVLDVGCGTAILSMLCARAGAAHVTGVDMSDVVYSAMDIVRENGLQERVSLVKGRLEDAALAAGAFDVIVSEWMGYFLLFEGMLDSVLWARDHLLAPGGRLLPSRCTMSLCAVSDTERYYNQVDFWTDVYGFRMSCLRPAALREASVEVVPAAAVCSGHAVIKHLDLNTVQVADTEFTAQFALPLTRPGPVTALVGYFDTMFELPERVQFSTGPHATPTHWKQTVFYLHRPLPLQQGDTLAGTLFCCRDRKDIRSLRVTITIGGESFSYRVA